MNKSLTTPIEVLRGEKLPHFHRFTQFLKVMQDKNVLNSNCKLRNVLYADDQFVSIEQVKRQFSDMNISNLLQAFSNGQDIIEFLQVQLDILDHTEFEAPIQPIRLVVLDINMPVLDGFETLKKVKEIFEVHNARTNDRLVNDSYPTTVSRPLVLRPFICLFSQLDGRQFAPFLKKTEQPDFYLKKPVPASELKSFLKLLKVL